MQWWEDSAINACVSVCPGEKCEISLMRRHGCRIAIYFNRSPVPLMNRTT